MAIKVNIKQCLSTMIMGMGKETVMMAELTPLMTRLQQRIT